MDNTILFHSITHETAWVPTGMAKWGPHDVDTGYAARIPVRGTEDESREYRNVRYLPGIAYLARIGKLTLMSSGELWTERFYQPSGRFNGYGYFDLDLFKDVEMPLVDSIPDMRIGPSWLGLPSVESARDQRLASSTDPLFRSLVSQLGPSNSQDAWHIRTAEVNEMFCFLTMDFKLLKTLRARSNTEPVKSLRTRIITPEELGRYLWLAPMDPVFLSFENANSPVRPDLHWPDSKRQKPKRRSTAERS
ncbi:hypothetical protein [Ideonella paludis]|uniref:hypothetical protein n=1 Tax=Ideonella paludis TaxID=1233411 RepID=UPI003631B817